MLNNFVEPIGYHRQRDVRGKLVRFRSLIWNLEEVRHAQVMGGQLIKLYRFALPF